MIEDFKACLIDGRPFDIVWCTANYLHKADQLLADLPLEEKHKRHIDGWRYYKECYVPGPIGVTGACVAVNYPGILSLRPATCKIDYPNKKVGPIQERYLQLYTLADGLTAGYIDPAFWKLPETVTAAESQLSKEQISKAACEKAILPDTVDDQQIQEATRAWLETIAWRCNPSGVTLPEVMTDKVLVNIAMMVKMTGQIVFPDLEEWLEHFVVPIKREKIAWQPRTYAEFIANAATAMAAVIKTNVKTRKSR